MMMPPRTVSFSSMRRTRMRSARGWIFMSSSSWIQVGPWGQVEVAAPGSAREPDRAGPMLRAPLFRNRRVVLARAPWPPHKSREPWELRRSMRCRIEDILGARLASLA
jgi:hypothetical protein